MCLAGGATLGGCGALILLQMLWWLFCSSLGCEAHACLRPASNEWLACFGDPALWVVCDQSALLLCHNMLPLVGTDHRGGGWSAVLWTAAQYLAAVFVWAKLVL